MKEGFYSVIYAGAADRGFGVLVLDSGMVYGVDVGGVLYDGTYKFNEATGKIDVKLEMTIPAGTHLVQGVPPRPTEWKMPIVAQLDRELGAERPITVQTPAGPVQAVFKKIRDFPHC